MNFKRLLAFLLLILMISSLFSGTILANDNPILENEQLNEEINKEINKEENKEIPEEEIPGNELEQPNNEKEEELVVNEEENEGENIENNGI